jgi:hypothetical protein
MRSRWLLVAALLGAACAPKTARTRVMTTDPQEIVHADAEEPRAQVPAGSMMTVRMLSEINTRTSKPGDRFEAAVVDPLIGRDGSVIVPAGSVVRGSVERAQKERGIALALDVVRVGSQDVALDAKVQAADVVPVTSEREGRVPHYAGATATFPAGTGGTVEPRYLEPDALRGGSRDHAGAELALPMGAQIYLVLTRPILL